MKPVLGWKNLRIAAQHPSLIIGALRGADSAQLTRNLIDIETKRLEHTVAVAGALNRTREDLEPLLSEWIGLLKRIGENAPFYVEPAPLVLYALLRICRPTTVVETGVNMGVSSSFILHAMRLNRTGHLYSVDLPEAEYEAPESTYDLGRHVKQSLPAGASTGFLVPDELRKLWTLRFGRTQEVLLPLLSQLGAVELFFRDSEHTYQAMKLEFELGWRFLKPGGILVSDNVDRNDAFDDFCRARRVESHAIRYVALAQKPFDAVPQRRESQSFPQRGRRSGP